MAAGWEFRVRRIPLETFKQNIPRLCAYINFIQCSNPDQLPALKSGKRQYRIPYQV